MASPVLPSDALEVVIQPDDSLCAALVKLLIRWPILFYKYTKYKYAFDGSFTTEFANEMCEALKTNCPDKTVEDLKENLY